MNGKDALRLLHSWEARDEAECGLGKPEVSPVLTGLLPDMEQQSPVPRFYPSELIPLCLG